MPYTNLNMRPVILISVVMLCSISCDFLFRNTSEADKIDQSLIDPYDMNSNYLDSIKLHEYTRQYPFLQMYHPEIQKFYSRRNYQCVWFNNLGLIEQGSLFINLMQSSKLELTDSINGLSQIVLFHNQIVNDSITGNEVRLMDVLLTNAFLEYADKKWIGLRDSSVKELGWYIKRKRLVSTELLDSITANPSFFSYYKPLNKQYELLRQYLVRLKTIEVSGGLPYIDTLQKAYRKGDTGLVIKNIRAWLYRSGFFMEHDSTNNRFDDALFQSVKLAQHCMGLKEDGVVGKSLIKQMNVSLNQRMQQILINLERMRWVEDSDTGKHIVINIPRYKLYAYHNVTLDWECNVVVGTTRTKTSIFNGNIRYVVLNPYWNVPNSILFNEIIPAYRKDKNYFVKHNMEVLLGKSSVNPADIKWSDFNEKNCPYMVRQLPGKDNPLGVVKFLFPNTYNIYLHDSPAKQYFDRQNRTFSHGCIRVGEPLALMQWVLQDEKQITPDRIQSIFETGKETYLNLKQGIPVTIAYYTAWIDENGYINYTDDVYKLDEAMKNILFLDGIKPVR